MLPRIVTVCPSTGKIPRLPPVPTTTLLVTVNVVVTLQLALAGTIRLPLTVLPGLGLGGQVVSAARATGSATNMSPNASIAASRCFTVSPLFCPRASKSAYGRCTWATADAKIILMGTGFDRKIFRHGGVRLPAFHPEQTSRRASSCRSGCAPLWPPAPASDRLPIGGPPEGHLRFRTARIPPTEKRAWGR